MSELIALPDDKPVVAVQVFDVADCYMALQVENSSEYLHITLVFTENASIDERISLWNAYSRALEHQLPLQLIRGELIKVGADKDVDAYECRFVLPALGEQLKSMYKTFARREGGVFPELLVHMTVDSPEKKQAAETVGDVITCTTLTQGIAGSKYRIASLRRTERTHF